MTTLILFCLLALQPYRPPTLEIYHPKRSPIPEFYHPKRFSNFIPVPDVDTLATLGDSAIVVRWNYHYHPDTLVIKRVAPPLSRLKRRHTICDWIFRNRPRWVYENR